MFRRASGYWPTPRSGDALSSKGTAGPASTGASLEELLGASPGESSDAWFEGSPDASLEDPPGASFAEPLTTSPEGSPGEELSMGNVVAGKPPTGG